MIIITIGSDNKVNSCVIKYKSTFSVENMSVTLIWQSIDLLSRKKQKGTSFHVESHRFLNIICLQISEGSFRILDTMIFSCRKTKLNVLSLSFFINSELSLLILLIAVIIPLRMVEVFPSFEFFW